MSWKKAVLSDMVLIIYDHSKSLGLWIVAEFMVTNSLILTSNLRSLTNSPFTLIFSIFLN